MYIKKERTIPPVLSFFISVTDIYYSLILSPLYSLFANSFVISSQVIPFSAINTII